MKLRGMIARVDKKHAQELATLRPGPAPRRKRNMPDIAIVPSPIRPHRRERSR